MTKGQELAKRNHYGLRDSGDSTRPENRRSLASQVFASDGLMALEHVRQSTWEQGVVGMLCAVGGSLLAYWSLQGVIGLAVIVLCVAFSTLVTAALCHYYDRAVRGGDDGTSALPSGDRGRVEWSAGQ